MRGKKDAEKAGEFLSDMGQWPTGETDRFMCAVRDVRDFLRANIARDGGRDSLTVEAMPAAYGEPATLAVRIETTVWLDVGEGDPVPLTDGHVTFYVDPTGDIVEQARAIQAMYERVRASAERGRSDSLARDVVGKSMRSTVDKLRVALRETLGVVKARLPGSWLRDFSEDVERWEALAKNASDRLKNSDA